MTWRTIDRLEISYHSFLLVRSAARRHDKRPDTSSASLATGLHIRLGRQGISERGSLDEVVVLNGPREAGFFHVCLDAEVLKLIRPAKVSRSWPSSLTSLSKLFFPSSRHDKRPDTFLCCLVGCLHIRLGR